MTSVVVTALCNQSEAFASDLGDDQSRSTALVMVVGLGVCLVYNEFTAADHKGVCSYTGRLLGNRFNPFSPTLFLSVAKISLPKRLAPYWSNPAYFIRALWRSALTARVPECQKLKRVG